MKSVRIVLILLTLSLLSTTPAAAVIDFSGFSGYDPNSLLLSSNSWSFNENGYHFSIANSQDNSLSMPANLPNASFPGEIVSTAITVTRLDGNVFDVMAFSILGGIDKSSSFMEVQPQLAGQDVRLPSGGSSDFYYDAWNGGNTYFYSDVPGVPSTFNPYADKTTALLMGYDSYKFMTSLGLTLTGLTLTDASIASVPLPGGFWLFLAGFFGLWRLAGTCRHTAKLLLLSAPDVKNSCSCNSSGC